MASLTKLNKDFDDCVSTCSDYSCTRMGGCTGYAGQKLNEYYSNLRNKEKQNQEYLKFKAHMDRYLKE